MSELTAAPGEREGLAPRKIVASIPARRAVGAALVTMAWRNLWRVRRRTWLTAGGVGFAVFLVVFTRSMQIGSLATMVEMGTEQMTGHVQVQHPDYLDDPRMRHTVGGLAAVTETPAGRPDVRAVAPRGTAFALVSAESLVRGASPSRSPAEGSFVRGASPSRSPAEGSTTERSFGAQVLGIDPAVEFATLSKRALPGGRPLERTGEALMGSALARNLGAEPGTDVVVLGTGKEGGIAATAVTLVGLFESGVPDLDRGVMLMHFDDFSEAFGLEDEAHAIAVLTRDPGSARDFAAEVSAAVGNATAGHDAAAGAPRVRPWQELQPELEQFVTMELGGSVLVAVLLIVIVTFVVVSTFVMTVFERTAEFGMLKAIGMTPAAIFRMVQLEGLLMSLLGVALGLVVVFATVSALAIEGIPISAFGDFDRMLARLAMPDTLMPVFDAAGALVITATMVVAVQLAAAVPGAAHLAPERRRGAAGRRMTRGNGGGVNP